MGDVFTFTDAAYSFLNNSKKEAIMLISVISPPPPDNYIILTYLLRLLSLFAKASPSHDARLSQATLRIRRIRLLHTRQFTKLI